MPDESAPPKSAAAPEELDLWRRFARALARDDATAGVASDSASRLHRDIERYLECEPALCFGRAGHFPTVNGQQIQIAPRDRALGNRLVATLVKSGLQAVRLEPGLALNELLALMRVLSSASTQEAAAVWRSVGVAHVHLQRGASTPGARSATGWPVHRKRAQRLYLEAVAMCTDLERATEEGRRPRLRDLKRIVHRLVDLAGERDVDLVGLTTVKSLLPTLPWVSLATSGTREAPRANDAPFAGGARRRNNLASGPRSTHDVNVAILSIVLGRAVGLDKHDLAQLGLAGLLHDVGIAVSVTTATRAQGQADADAPAPAQSATHVGRRLHSLRGAMRVLKMGPLDHVAHAALTAVEQHLDLEPEGTDLPSTVPNSGPGLASRIVQIADVYDLLTSPVDGVAASPAQALRHLQNHAGTRFDAALWARFAALLGPYPPGTAVQLEGGATAVVIEANANPAASDRPRVRLLLDAQGRAFEDEPAVDLAATPPQAHPLARPIVCVVEPMQFDLDPAVLFLGPI